MATYSSALAQAGQKAYTPVAGVSIVAYAEITTTTAATNDVYLMIPIPAGARVMNWTLGVDQLDTNGAATLTLSLGDSGSSTRYVNASTIGRSASSAPVQALTYTGFAYQYTSDDVLRVTVTAGAATYAAGKIRVYIEYMPAWY